MNEDTNQSHNLTDEALPLSRAAIPSQPDLSTSKIEFHQSMGKLMVWAESCGTTERRLRVETELRIRNQHKSAKLIEQKSLRDGSMQKFHELAMGKNFIFYSIETSRILVRGYAWSGFCDPDDSWGNGGFYS